MRDLRLLYSQGLDLNPEPLVNLGEIHVISPKPQVVANCVFKWYWKEERRKIKEKLLNIYLIIRSFLKRSFKKIISHFDLNKMYEIRNLVFCYLFHQ